MENAAREPFEQNKTPESLLSLEKKNGLTNLELLFENIKNIFKKCYFLFFMEQYQPEHKLRLII